MNPLSKYALTMTPVALSLEELLPSTSQSNFVMLLMRTFLVFSTLVVALAVPFFGKISYRSLTVLKSSLIAGILKHGFIWTAASVMALLGSVFTMLVVNFFSAKHNFF